MVILSAIGNRSDRDLLLDKVLKRGVSRCSGNPTPSVEKSIALSTTGLKLFRDDKLPYSRMAEWLWRQTLKLPLRKLLLDENCGKNSPKKS
ncbi:hypothetical protein CEXT_215811 [Caerostris extrusa]|uniref:Uncharacterized protein n=1 Tax=Caerostris extrusa TaxID=172846 RepID=A0AAV4MMI9_CAEEX|nr:hypothetical protein CEXT_215811 [Caerostris extrusa]